MSKTMGPGRCFTSTSAHSRSSTDPGFDNCSRFGSFRYKLTQETTRPDGVQACLRHQRATLDHRHKYEPGLPGVQRQATSRPYAGASAVAPGYPGSAGLPSGGWPLCGCSYSRSAHPDAGPSAHDLGARHVVNAMAATFVTLTADGTRSGGVTAVPRVWSCVGTWPASSRSWTVGDGQRCRCSGRAGYPGAGGGLWLRMTFPPGLVTWLVPSGETVSFQPIWWSTT